MSSGKKTLTAESGFIPTNMNEVNQITFQLLFFWWLYSWHNLSMFR